MGKEEYTDEFPYDFPDRDARRRRLVEQSRREDFRRRSETFRRLEKERRSFRFRTFLAAAALCLSLAAGVLFYSHNYRMTTYSVDSELQQKGLQEASVYSFGSGAIMISGDSAAYIADGSVLWSEKHSFSEPLTALRGSYFVLFERDGKELRIFDESGHLSTISLSRRIRAADISLSGVTAAVTEEDDAFYISYFDRFGSSLSVEIRALFTQSGYPMDLSLSPDGQRLAVVYRVPAGTESGSRLLIYDFQSGTERAGYVTAELRDFTETDTFLLDAGFLGNDCLALIGDNMLYLYSVSGEGAELCLSRTLGENMLSVLFSEEALAVAERSGEELSVCLYGTDFSETRVPAAVSGISGMELGSTELLIWDGADIVLANRNGRIRYEGTLTEEPADLCFAGRHSLLINNGKLLRQITLK